MGQAQYGRQKRMHWSSGQKSNRRTGSDQSMAPSGEEGSQDGMSWEQSQMHKVTDEQRDLQTGKEGVGELI